MVKKLLSIFIAAASAGTLFAAANDIRLSGIRASTLRYLTRLSSTETNSKNSPESAKIRLSKSSLSAKKAKQSSIPLYSTQTSKELKHSGSKSPQELSV